MAIGYPKWTKDANGISCVEKGPDGRTVFDVSYEGAVLTTRERNFHDDSDFYAVVWDEVTKSVKEVEYATTRFYTYDNWAKVDATDEVKAKANEWLVNWYEPQVRAAAEAEAKKPIKDKTVRVVAGRKVPKGTLGMVFWYGDGKNFGPAPRYRGGWTVHVPKRVGIKAENGETYWTDAKNVEVTDWKQYMPSDAEIKARAEGIKNSWHAPFAYGRGLLVA